MAGEACGKAAEKGERGIDQGAGRDLSKNLHFAKISVFPSASVSLL